MSVFNDTFSEGPAKAAAPVAAVTDDKPEVDTPPPETQTAETPEPAEPSSAKEDTPEAEPPKAPSERDEQGRFVKMVPHEALHAERKRREAVEAELAAVRQAQQKPPTSVLEDEDKAFQERLSAVTEPIIRQNRQTFFDLTLELAQEKPGREDFDEVYQFVEQECKEHPELITAIVAARNPGEYIYQLGKSRKALAAAGGDLTKLREQIEGESRAKLNQAAERIKTLEAELSALRGSKEKRDAIPESLNGEPSGSVKGDSFAGPTPLRSLFTS